jgi:chromosome segregation ATPase
MPPRAGNTSELFERFEALQLSHRELEGQMAGLHGDVEDRDRQLASLAAELGARDVRVSALRHEVRVRDALLGHLHEDSLKKAEHKDHEVERLVEQAMLPLTTILSSRQAASAAAVGERSLLAH